MTSSLANPNQRSTVAKSVFMSVQEVDGLPESGISSTAFAVSNFASDASATPLMSSLHIFSLLGSASMARRSTRCRFAGIVSRSAAPMNSAVD